MKAKIAALSAIALFATAGTAFAQQQQNEISLFGNLQNSKSSAAGSQSYNQGNISAAYGRYFMPQLVGRVLINSSFSQSAGGGTNTFTLAGVGAKYYFKAGKRGDLVPFVDVQVLGGGNNQSPKVTYTSWNGSVGGSYFLTEAASFDASLGYQRDTVKVSGASNNQNDIIFNFGLTYRF